MPDEPFPPAVLDATLVGSYPSLVKAGGGYVWDAVLEYRVWVHPVGGAKGEDSYFAFVSFEEAAAFAADRPGAEEPLALVLQEEYITEPEPGQFEHATDRRIAEWRVEWLRRPRRTPTTIPAFFAADPASNRLDLLRGTLPPPQTE